MAQRTAPLLPASELSIQRLGERLRLARQRRRMPAKQMAERAGMSPMTLRSLERGGSGVTIAAYVAVMQVLGIESDLDLLARNDTVGRELQDARLPARAPSAAKSPMPAVAPATKRARTRRAARESADWMHDGEFTSSEHLASLLDEPAVSSRVAKPRRPQRASRKR